MTLHRTLLNKYVFTSDKLLKYKDRDNSDRNYMMVNNEIRADIKKLFAFIYQSVLTNKPAHDITANDLDFWENFDCDFRILPHAHVVITIYCNTKKESRLITHYDNYVKSNEICPVTKDFFEALREEIYRDDLPL